MSSSTQVSAHAARSLDLPFFDGFPYLLTRSDPAVYHILVLPAMEPEALRLLARRQLAANRLPCCLVLGEDLGLYLEPDGGERLSNDIPRGGYLVTRKLLPALAFKETGELQVRERELDARVQRQPSSGFVMGDLTKGGRPATQEDLVQLGGHATWIPRRLSRCPKCGEWQGRCLDPNRGQGELVVRVHCRCDNWNRCAWCGKPLYERRLAANYFNPVDAKVWHVPGFTAFGHHC